MSEAVSCVLMYADGTFWQEGKCTGARMDAAMALANDVRMAKKPGKLPHFIRDWRKHRNLTLERLADRVGSTHATLSRIERYKLPYGEPLLEAIADALGTTADAILKGPPGARDELQEVIDQLTPEKQRSAVAIIRALKDAA